MRAALPLLLALSAAVPHHLAAQSPADRAALEALRDSLTGVRDSIALKRLEAAGIELAKRHRDDSDPSAARVPRLPARRGHRRQGSL